MTFLLDDKRIDGPQPMARAFGPVRKAIAVPSGDWERVSEIVALASQYWGGGGHLLVPVGEPSSSWATLLRRAQIDHIAVADKPDGEGIDGAFPMTGWIGTPLLSVLWGQQRTTEDWRTVANARVPADDPWSLAYLGTLGVWPDDPSRQVLEWGRMRPDVRFADIIPVSNLSVTEPGVDDLWRRLTSDLCPLPLTLFGLVRRPKSAPLIPVEPVIPDPDRWHRALAGNIVVVYEPQSVGDLCLLWNLRADWDQPIGLPLAVPNSPATAADIRRLLTIGGAQAILGSERCLVSRSVPRADLEQLADELGSSWKVGEAEDLLRPKAPISTVSNDVAIFGNGRARFVALARQDEQLIGRAPTLLHPQAEIRAQPLGRPLPPIASLAGTFPGDRGYRHGSQVVPFDPGRELIELRWPSGATVLGGAARDRGLWCKPSSAGTSAVALLRFLGGDAHLSLIATPGIFEMLHRLGERRGITWFRERMREVAQAASSVGSREDAVERLIDEFRGRPQDDDQMSVTVADVARILDRDSAGLWLTWAETSHLLVRGSEVRCETCGASSWRALAELAPPIVCRGCGEPIHQPFRPDVVTFRYRASEALLNCTAHDSLAHLLTYRWFVELWRQSFDRPSDLYGAYPGVEFGRIGSTQAIGEADVLLLMANGELIPGEVKRRGAGLSQNELAKLARLREMLGATWSFVATPSWADDCPPIWRETTHDPAGNPIFALTGEHVFDRRIFWALGDNPFAWRTSTAEERQGLERDFRTSLPGIIEWMISEDPEPYWRPDQTGDE